MRWFGCRVLVVIAVVGELSGGGLAAQPARGQAVAVAERLPAEALEAAGLFDDARTKALEAFPSATPSNRLRYMQLLERLALRAKISAAALRQTQYDQQMSLGAALLRSGLADQAKQAFLKAVDLADRSSDRDAAVLSASRPAPFAWSDLWSLSSSVAAVHTVLASAIGVMAGFLIAVAVLPLAWPLKRMWDRVSDLFTTARAKRSDRVIVGDFKDTTGTGLGAGFPDLVRTLYGEQRRLATMATLGGSLLVPYRVQGSLPVLSGPVNEEFAAVKLEVGSVPLGRVLAWLDRIWNAPWCAVGGTVYRTGGIVRATVSVKPAAGRARGWDTPLTGGTARPHDAAYRVIFALLDEWEKQP